MKTKIPSAEEGEASEIRVPSPILLATWIELLYARTIDFAVVATIMILFFQYLKRNKFPFVGIPLHKKSGAEIAEESSVTSRSETERNLAWFLPGLVKSLLKRNSKEIRTA